MMVFVRRLLSDRRGAAIMEFALLAPVFMMGMFGIIEVSRFLWTKQTLDEVAYATVRCAAVSTSCDTLSKQRDFAVSRASGYGVNIVRDQVTLSEPPKCNSLPNSVQANISLSFDSVLGGFIPSFPSSLTATACYPKLS